jgi:6-phosphogluconolactonase/glucosamine-6-phosphate isomerase/deaminase
MKTSEKRTIVKRSSGDRIWLTTERTDFAPVNKPFEFEVLANEEAVGQAMFDELASYAAAKEGDITIILLGGRGAQAMYRIINRLAETSEIDGLLSRLNVFTQDALAPMRMNYSLSFVRDFERILGQTFLRKIKSFTPMLTETDDIEGALIAYLEKLESLGGIDIFFIGLGPEAEAASHVCYIKPGSGAKHADIAGIIPISGSILEHHIGKFKVGGSEVSPEDEAECRRATHILTLGPAAILGAGRLVQSIVDASTAPGKPASFKRMIETEISTDPEIAARQCDENPGLWVRLHNNVRSLILPDVLTNNA